MEINANHKLILIFCFNIISVHVFAQRLPEWKKKAIHYEIPDSLQIQISYDNADSFIENVLMQRDSANEEKSAISLELYAGNHYNTNGRTFGTNQVAFGSLLNFYHKKGFSVYAGEESWSSQGAAPEFYYPGLAYIANINDWLTLNANLEHWFFVNNGPKSKKILDNNFRTSLELTFGKFTEEISGSLTWNQRTALQFESKSSLWFEKYNFLGSDKISLVPEILVSAGTPNSIWQGYRKLQNTVGKHVVVDVSKYSSRGIYLLSFQTGIPITFYRKRTEFSLAWYYTKPYNSFAGEILKPLSWFQIDLLYYFFRQ